MRLDHSDYIRLVVDAYHKKRANNELSLLLTQSSPAKIRKECLNVYQERYNKKDEQVLRAFFGPAEQGKKFLQSIREFKTAKFKPLDNYLKGGTEKTEDINLELLAWLIDFPYRPYVFRMEVVLNENELSIIGKSVKKPNGNEIEPYPELTGSKEELDTKLEDVRKSLPEETEEGLLTDNMKPEILSLANSTNSSLKNIRKKAAIIFLCLAISSGGMYFIGQREESRQLPVGKVNTGCMYWADDHYEQVPCNEERKGRLILPLNEEKMKSFKRITMKDTITERSIGKVYYIKSNKKIEYYTEGGNHPVETTRSLKKLSAYMFDKYLRNQEMANESLLSEKPLKFINNH